MGILDRLRGMGVQRPVPQSGEAMSDEQAIARYRYLLRTAPPETIEAAHADAFARLTPDQRAKVLQQLAAAIPEAERAAVGDDPASLARAATRAELRQPGTMERAWSGVSTGPGFGAPGMGGLFAGSFLSSMAGTVLGSMIAQHFLADHAHASGLFGDTPGADAASREHGYPFTNAGDDRNADHVSNAGDTGGAGASDFDSGGDFGGGDFDTGFDAGGSDGFDV
jgi:hypothetical protein